MTFSARPSNGRLPDDLAVAAVERHVEQQIDDALACAPDNRKYRRRPRPFYDGFDHRV
jgi:hypothetical protein